MRVSWPVATLMIACACGRTPPQQDGGGTVDDTGDGGSDPSASASVEDGAGPGGEVDGNLTLDPDEGGGNPSDTGAFDESTGGAVELCEHAPSGLVPGSVIWELPTPPMIAGDVVATEYGVTLVNTGEGHASIAGLKGGDVYWSTLWDAPDAVASVGRQLVALPGGLVVAGIDGLPVADACVWCSERWLVAYDDAGALQWETGLGTGAWAIAATPSGTIAVVGATSMDGASFRTTLFEVDAEGAVIRQFSGETKGSVAIPKNAVVGSDGGVVAIGTFDEFSDSGWLGGWSSGYEFNWAEGGSVIYFGIALGSNDDLLVPEGYTRRTVDLARRSFDGGVIWNLPMNGAPNDIAVDCNDDIVLAVGAVSRLDPKGTPIWATQVASEAVAVAIDPEGDVIVVANAGEQLLITELAGS